MGNTMWDNSGKSGWNNKCREGRTGLHYDPTVACSSLSENLITPSARRRLVERRLAPKVPYCVQDNGRTVKAEDYACNPKKKQNTCERGDLSGKLGQLVVIKNSSDKLLVKFKGTDTFFPRKNVAEMEINSCAPSLFLNVFKCISVMSVSIIDIISNL